MTRVVAALSGGSARAAAHVGVVKALFERDLAPAHYVGTSMGAVVAACFAAGVSYEELVDRMVRVRRSDVALPGAGAVLGYFSTAFLRAGPLRATIAGLVPARRFDRLALPLTVTAVDRVTGELVLFGEGGRPHVPLVDALVASCALPVYYPPARVAGREYLDGGLRSVLPLDVAGRFQPDLLVGSYVGPVLFSETAAAPPRIPPLVRVAGDVLRITMAAQAEAEVARWQERAIVIRPRIEAETTFAVDRVAEFIGEGYRAAVRALGSRGYS